MLNVCFVPKADIQFTSTWIGAKRCFRGHTLSTYIRFTENNKLLTLSEALQDIIFKLARRYSRVQEKRKMKGSLQSMLKVAKKLKHRFKVVKNSPWKGKHQAKRPLPIIYPPQNKNQ